VNLKTILLASTLFLTPIFATAQKYPVNEKGFPTSEGIRQYVYDNEENFITDFEKYVKDTLWQAYFEVESKENLKDYTRYKGWELGWHSGGGSILLSDQEDYSGYSLKNLSKYEKSQFLEANNFVRGVALHELTHAYIEQLSGKLLSKKIDVTKEYWPSTPFQKDNSTIYSKFIEDGIAEYISMEMGEMILPKKLFVPKNIEEFFDTTKIYESRYQYAYKYVKNFLNVYGIKNGTIFLVTNSPPTEKEILNPTLYFGRLKHYGGLKLPKIITPQDFKTKQH
jgi:hypothetical protein